MDERPTYVNTYTDHGSPVMIEIGPGIGYAIVRSVNHSAIREPLLMSAEELDALSRAANYAAMAVRKATADGTVGPLP